MRPARLEADVQKRMPGEELDELEVRDGVARRLRVERMPHRVPAITADRRFDPAAPRPRTAHDEREVAALELTSPDERLQPAIGLLRARDDHQAGGVAVEPVDDARPRGLTTGDVVSEQTVHKRPGRVSRRRMHDETRRLVDDDEVLVRVDEPQLHRFGRELRLAHGWLEVQLLAPGQPMAFALLPSVDENCTGLEQSFGDTT